MEKARYSYDDYSDSLILSVKAQEEKVKNNFEIQDFVFSLAGSGKIVGVEIRDFSKVLEDMGLDTNIMENVKEIYLKISAKKGRLEFNIKFETTVGNAIAISRNIPLPLVC